MEAMTLGDPGTDLRMLVARVVVHHDMRVEVFGDAPVDLA
jgi:hypothetical protein